MPSLETPVGQRINYYVRTGSHDVTGYDWGAFVGSLDRTLLPWKQFLKGTGCPRLLRRCVRELRLDLAQDVIANDPCG